jgi:RNA polymerase sigma-70 factor, ECF subfamily
MTQEVGIADIFADLYQRHYRQVRNVCRRLLSSQDHAEDATQEVFLRAYRSFHRYDTKQAFARWIMSIASHYCVDLLRQRSRSPLLLEVAEEELLEVAAIDMDSLGALLATEQEQQLQTALQSALQSLPDRYRMPFTLAYVAEGPTRT